jgi:hypothetical protein
MGMEGEREEERERERAREREETKGEDCVIGERKTSEERP